MLTVAALDQSNVGTVLLKRIAGFTSYLHANGYGVSAADSVNVVDATALTGVLDQAILRWNLKSLLCNRIEEWQRFDALFDAYFLPPNIKVFAEEGAAVGKPEAGTTGDDDLRDLSDTSGSAEADETEADRYGASREENLSSTDFSELDQADQARKIEALMRRLARRLKLLKLRREVRSQRGRRLDLRAPAPGAAAGRQSLDEFLQFFLSATRTRVVQRTRGRTLFRFSHPHHKCRRGVERSGPMAGAGTIRRAYGRLVRWYAHRRMLDRFQPRSGSTARAFPNWRDHCQ
jgi:hypothetical protein